MKRSLVILHLFFLCFCDYASSQYEIRCELPKIPHGMVPNLKTEYKENERLSYFCEKNYRPRQGIPVCLRVGWSITPECEEINCLLGPPTPGTSTSPKGKNVFRAGESVEITCSESHWLFGTRQTRQSIICKESGEWEHSPVCEEITCDIPYDQHVDYVHYYFSRDRRLGVKKPYRCERGYRAGARTATCTEKGWLPNPLCTAKILECDKPPSIAHAVYDFKEQHKDGEKVTYHCPLYYVMEGNPYMTCTQGRWTGSVKCLEPCTVSVPVMNVHHIQLLNGGRQKIYAKHGDHIVFTCQEKHALVEGSVALRQMCNNGVIALPVCQ